MLPRLVDPAARDMDVHALHQVPARRARAWRAPRHRRGAARAQYSAGDGRIDTSAGERCSAARQCRGAWVDEVAVRAASPRSASGRCGRTAMVLNARGFLGAHAWRWRAPLTRRSISVRSRRFLASPADQTPSPPCDAQPDELDLATLVARIEAATQFHCSALPRNGGPAQLRRRPDAVAGFDAQQPAFFWLAGQGLRNPDLPGDGDDAAALVLGREIPQPLRDAGIDPGVLHPRRLRAKGPR